jgi:DNA-binding NarL/FixJ family response regulator
MPGERLTTQEIADKLSISTRRAVTRLRNILGKLGLDNRTQAALCAIEQGIVESNPDS